MLHDQAIISDIIIVYFCTMQFIVQDISMPPPGTPNIPSGAGRLFDLQIKKNNPPPHIIPLKTSYKLI